jgi:preprotein translocase subunit SecB
MTDLSTEIAIEAPKGGFAGAEYNAVAKSAQLQGINLLSNNFVIDPNCLMEQNQWKLSHGRKVLSCHFSDEDHSVAAILQYNVIAKFGRKRALLCTADYGVFYAIPNGASQEAASAFCLNVGTFAAYPYFRALFAQLAGEAGLMLPPLPSIASTAHIPPKEPKKVKTK